MFINKLTFGPIQRGAYFGLPAIHIEFGGEPETKEEVADFIINLRKVDVGRYRHIVMSGDFPEDKMVIIIKSFLDSKFLVQADVKGMDGFRPWLFNCTNVVVELDTPNWPVFKCNELFYKVVSMKQPDPELPVDAIPKLYVESTMDGDKILKWIRNSKLPWCVQRKISEEIKL